MNEIIESMCSVGFGEYLHLERILCVGGAVDCFLGAGNEANNQRPSLWGTKAP